MPNNQLATLQDNSILAGLVVPEKPEKPTDILADIVDKYCSEYIKVRGDKVSEIAIYQQEDRASACFNIKTSTGEFYHFYI